MKEMESFDRFGSSVAIAAALRTGLLFELTKGRATVAGLAAQLNLNERATALILDLLECEQLARRDGDGFVAGEALTRLSTQPGGYDLSLRMWAHVETFVRTGEPFIMMDLAPADREQSYQKVVADLGKLFEGVATELAAKLPLTPKRILDVGCGSGVWSLAIAARHPASRVTGLDFPAVLENFTARSARLGLGERSMKIPGDMHQAEIPPQAFDLVIIANVLRLETPSRAAAILKRLAPAVAPGGSLLVIDALAHGTPERDRARSLYALHLGLRTKEGQVHSPTTITGWLNEAGFSRVQSVDVAAGVGGVGALLASGEE